jgi:hypothetical protein
MFSLGDFILIPIIITSCLSRVFFKQMLTICHANKITGTYLSDKSHSRSLCKSQGHSKCTLYVNQSFNDHCAYRSLK